MDFPHIAIELVLSATFALGLALNCLALRAWKHHGHWLTLTWSICNLVSLASTPLLVLTMNRGTWIAGAALCRLYMASSTLGQWASAWLMITAAMPRIKLHLLPIIIIILIPTALVFSYTDLVKTEKSCHCLLTISSYNDHLWVTLIGYLFSYHTPLTIALCCIAMKYKLSGRSVLLLSGLTVSHGALWLPHWVMQIHLLLSEENSSLTLHLFANTLTQIHAAIARYLFYC